MSTSTSLDTPVLFDESFLLPRRSSMDGWNTDWDESIINAIHANHLRERLLEKGHEPRYRWDPHELATMIKIEESGLQPWEAGFPITPTPPEERTDTLTPTSLKHLTKTFMTSAHGSSETPSLEFLEGSGIVSSTQTTISRSSSHFEHVEPSGTGQNMQHNKQSKDRPSPRRRPSRQTSTRRRIRTLPKAQVVRISHAMITRSRREIRADNNTDRTLHG